MSRDTIEIRRAIPTDAAALAALSAQLGYPVPARALADRLGRVLRRTDQVVLVGCGAANDVVGWIHGAEQDLLEAERRCEILGGPYFIAEIP